MAQPHDISPRADPPISSSSVGIPRLGLDGQRLRRYLPPDQAEEIVRDLSGPDAPPNQVVEAFEKASGRKAKVSHIPLAVVKAMSRAIKPMHPGISRVMRLGIVSETTDQTFDASLFRSRMPIALTSLDDWIRNRLQT